MFSCINCCYYRSFVVSPRQSGCTIVILCLRYTSNYNTCYNVLSSFVFNENLFIVSFTEFYAIYIPMVLFHFYQVKLVIHFFRLDIKLASWNETVIFTAKSLKTCLNREFLDLRYIAIPLVCCFSLACELYFHSLVMHCPFLKPLPF